jgi:transcriptional regulator with XRE-family HTH domain
VATRTRRIDRARWKADRSLSLIGDELRETRLSAALTQRELGRVIGLSPAEISRIERGRSPQVPYRTLVLVAGALGLDLPLRPFPNGDPIRDAGQLELLARFRAVVGDGYRHRTEVPLGIPGDRRAWDEVLERDGWSIPVEAETRLRDTQALRRRLALKCRDAHVDALLLVVADSRHNRHVLRLAQDDFAESFPSGGRDALAALRRGDRPASSAVLLV